MKYLITLLAITLISCAGSYPTERYVIRSEIIKDIQHPVIHLAKGSDSYPNNWVTYVDDIDQFVVSYPADYPTEKPIFMNEMSLERYKECPLTQIHMQKIQELKKAGRQARWGEVIYTSKIDPLLEEKNVYCPPRSNGYAYAFCSQKNKAVAICIQTDEQNESTAQQIFESFRWTEE